MTPEKWQQVFITHLAKTSNVSASARKAKVSRNYVYETRKTDEAFATAWDEALEIATEALEAEARRRAAVGFLEPVFYLGKKAGAVRKYSDTLLIFLLKAHKPQMYRDNVRHEHTGANGGPITTATMTVEEWTRQQDEAERQADATMGIFEDEADGE